MPRKTGSVGSNGFAALNDKWASTFILLCVDREFPSKEPV